MPEKVNLVCHQCGALNKVPAGRLADGPRCGKCHRPILEPRPMSLTASKLERHLEKSQLPLVVDFWASWCGPCKMMAPAFEQAATVLHPDVLLAKINTEEEQALAGRMGIMSIPTMVLYKSGREAARTSGAMNAEAIVGWVRQRL
jgi:thioredoxin 2